MRKIIIALIALFAFPALSFAFSAGNYEVLQNLNIRSPQGVSGARIGFFEKGTVVKVTAVSGEWCKVDYKKYKNAFVYCPLLGTLNTTDNYIQPGAGAQAGATGAQPQDMNAANKTLDDFNHWLMDNKEFGRKYINSSYATGWTAALEWQKDAGPTSLIFDYPFNSGAKCIFSYVSPSDPDNIYKFNCSETGKPGASGVITKNAVGNTDIIIPDSFKVPLAAVAARMIDGNGKIRPLLNSNFAASKSVKMEFTLSAKKDGTFWDVKVTDEKGKTLRLKVDGTDMAADFIVNP
jgi:hypothetical protein